MRCDIYFLTGKLGELTREQIRVTERVTEAFSIQNFLASLVSLYVQQFRKTLGREGARTGHRFYRRPSTQRMQKLREMNQHALEAVKPEEKRKCKLHGRSRYTWESIGPSAMSGLSAISWAT